MYGDILNLTCCPTGAIAAGSTRKNRKNYDKKTLSAKNRLDFLFKGLNLQRTFSLVSTSLQRMTVEMPETTHNLPDTGNTQLESYLVCQISLLRPRKMIRLIVIVQHLDITELIQHATSFLRKQQLILRIICNLSVVSLKTFRRLIIIYCVFLLLIASISSTEAISIFRCESSAIAVSIFKTWFTAFSSTTRTSLFNLAIFFCLWQKTICREVLL